MILSKLIKISVFLLLPTSLMTGCLDFFSTIQSNSYQNYEEAAAAGGAIERGWIPDFLPVSATNIREKHDLDTNDVLLKFDIDPKESTNFSQHCQQVDTFSPPEQLTAKWWSKDLVSSADTYLYCDDYEAYMVVENNTVYYWRP